MKELTKQCPTEADTLTAQQYRDGILDSLVSYMLLLLTIILMILLIFIYLFWRFVFTNKKQVFRIKINQKSTILHTLIIKQKVHLQLKKQVF